ncbi:RagB/SusD family nutrient uptake outer membrane protein [Proteiniphilum sp.]|uniref:RagB/SusD family nutrient uptake outer membrane protein n=1 Tax=Proteiniphilum sp. TaxID=1926877 RepID=UPI00331BBF15
MKRKYLYFILLLIIGSTSCNDFLDRYPLDAIGEVSYFTTPSDLRTYMNSFYSTTYFAKYPNHGGDFNSDNQVGTNVDTRLQGTRVVATSGSIGFGWIRRVNYFFDQYKRVEENYELKDYQQYLGEAYFFRALSYYTMLQQYGDIQWIAHALNTDSPELYNPRDSRDIVATNIILALDSAAMYLITDKTKGQGRVNKWMALLIQSRIALYEGTWQKYHAETPFGVQGANPNKYLQKAADAALELIESGPYDIYTTGDPLNDYYDLFALQDYSNNPEIMFWREYNNELSRGDTNFTNDRNHRMEFPNNNSITKQLADSYLCHDGLPISVSPLFEGHESLKDEMKNRDPRFFQNIATHDRIWRIQKDGTIEYWKQVYDNLNTNAAHNSPGGYINIKGYNPDMNYHVQQYEESPGIIYRYAEALLNFAEAKAELGTIIQQDLDISINKLRRRVGMPDLKVDNIVTDPDWDFPILSPLINEIRRERRVELACEGYRWDDIARWAAADELIVGKRPKGFKTSQLVTNPFPVDENGFLDPFRNAIPNGYGFILGRDYLNSIPISELVLNSNLTQNPGWEGID